MRKWALLCVLKFAFSESLALCVMIKLIFTLYDFYVHSITESVVESADHTAELVDPTADSTTDPVKIALRIWAFGNILYFFKCKTVMKLGVIFELLLN